MNYRGADVMRVGAKELQGAARVQMRHFQQIGVQPEVVGTRRRREVPAASCAVRVSAKCRALNLQHRRLYWVCREVGIEMLPQLVELLGHVAGLRLEVPQVIPPPLPSFCPDNGALGQPGPA